MDWITVLQKQQSDFIERLKAGCLLHCETQGQYSEVTIISGERLKRLREFCWQMAEKYKRTSAVRDVFINNLKGKLGEEVVKERLADFVTEVDYEKRFGGDGKIDFTLTSDPSIGVEVKSRHGSFDKIRWSVSVEEVEKNAVVVCILIQEEVSEAQPEYHLFLAGFLPTKIIKLKTGKISFGIGQLLYGGGLHSYLEQFQSPDEGNFYTNKFSDEPRSHNIIYSYHHENLSLLHIKLGDECFKKKQYQAAITAYSQGLQLKPDDADTYYKRGLACYHLEDYQAAIRDYLQAIAINPYCIKAYHKIGLARYQLKDYQGAIADFTQAMRINSNDALAYRNRAGVRCLLGDYQGAIEDYTQAIKIYPQVDTKSVYLIGDKQDFTQRAKVNNDTDSYCQNGKINYTQGYLVEAIADYTQAIKTKPSNADAYYQRGNVYYDLEDKQKAIEDFQKAAELYQKAGKLAEHKKARERILDLEIEASLDILNF